MATLKDIDSYQIYVASHPQFNEWQANIMMRKSGQVVVDVRFVADPANWASHSSLNPTGVSLIYVGIERLPWFVDILRNEKPLYVALYPTVGTSPVKMLLQTSSEPVGEGETV